MKTARTGPPRRGPMLRFSYQNLPKNRKKKKSCKTRGDTVRAVLFQFSLENWCTSLYLYRVYAKELIIYYYLNSGRSAERIYDSLG